MYGNQNIKLIEKERPTITNNTVLVKVKSCGLCTWEQKMYNNKNDESFPFAGGHEIYGIVEEVGSNISQNLKKGDHVAVAKLTRCGECYYCRKGYNHLCENSSEELGSFSGPGGFTEYLLAYGYEVYKINNTDNAEVFTLAEPLACVIRSIERADISIGDSVLIIGAGIMGYLNAILARQIGVKVIVSEPDKERRLEIEQYVDHTIDPFNQDLKSDINKFTNGQGVNATIFTAGDIDALQLAMETLDVNGRLVVYGSVRSEGDLQVPPSILHYDEVYLSGVTKHTKKSFAKAVKLLELDGNKFNKLISKRVEFTEIEKAFELAIESQYYRIVIDM